MNFAYFFARRIAFRQQRNVSGLVVRLAIASIALAIAVMEISLSFVQGFETEIQRKVIGFGSHIQLGNYFSMDEEEIPLKIDREFVGTVRGLENVETMVPFVVKWGIMQAEENKIGLVLKGVDSTYDWRFFKTALLEGKLPRTGGDRGSREVLLSRRQARQLALSVGDKALIYFLDDPVRRRPVTVAGIYETGMEEFDETFAIGDMRMIQRVRGWKPEEVSGYEINLRDFSRIDSTADIINTLSIDYAVYPITRLYPDIFDWLRLQHQNVYFILLLMIIVAVINMSSVVLILIIERTRTIGVLKSLGASNFRLQKLFIWNAFFLIVLGITIGNLLGLGLLWAQSTFGFIRLDQASYFIEQVPVAWVWNRFAWVNIGVVAICSLFMLFPTLVISRISPIRAIRFT